jgi:hypothetical protein
MKRSRVFGRAGYAFVRGGDGMPHWRAIPQRREEIFQKARLLVRERAIRNRNSDLLNLLDGLR